MDFDRFFKVALLLILAGFLFTYYQSTQVNRYVQDGSKIFDSKTGLLYRYSVQDEELKLIGY